MVSLATAVSCIILIYFQKATRLLLARLPQTPSAEPLLRAERRKDQDGQGDTLLPTPTQANGQ